MPLSNPNEPEVYRVDKESFIGMVEKFNLVGLALDDFADDMGTRALAELGDDWYDLRLELGFYDRMGVNSEKSFNVNMPLAAMKQVAQDGQVDGVNHSMNLEMDENKQRKLAHSILNSYIFAWSHAVKGADNPNPVKLTAESVKRIKPNLARCLQSIAWDIHRGQFLTQDSPLPITSET